MPLFRLRNFLKGAAAERWHRMRCSCFMFVLLCFATFAPEKLYKLSDIRAAVQRRNSAFYKTYHVKCVYPDQLVEMHSHVAANNLTCMVTYYTCSDQTNRKTEFKR